MLVACHALRVEPLPIALEIAIIIWGRLNPSPLQQTSSKRDISRASLPISRVLVYERSLFQLSAFFILSLRGLDDSMGERPRRGRIPFERFVARLSRLNDHCGDACTSGDGWCVTSPQGQVIIQERELGSGVAEAEYAEVARARARAARTTTSHCVIVIRCRATAAKPGARFVTLYRAR